MVCGLVIRKVQRRVRECDADEGVRSDAPESDVTSLHGASANLRPGQSSSLNLAPELGSLSGSALEVTAPQNEFLSKIS